jgi:hypothetical protein
MDTNNQDKSIKKVFFVGNNCVFLRDKHNQLFFSMKKFHTLIILLTFGIGTSTLLPAQPPPAEKCACTAEQVIDHIGENCEIVGTVSQSYMYEGKVRKLFLNIDGKYPNSKLTVVIDESDFAAFPDDLSNHYTNQKVSIKGKPYWYENRKSHQLFPQVKISSPKEITILEQ